MKNGTYRIKEAAEMIGVHPSTLKRWIKQKKIREVGRDIRGWRVFTQEDIESIRRYASQIVPPEEATKQIHS